MRKNTVIIILSALLLMAGLLLIRNLRESRADPGLISLEEIRKIREFHVVSFRYEDLFFYHNKQDQGKRVVAIASVPVSLRAYFDMSLAMLEQTDSLLILHLPSPEITDPSYAFDEMRTKSVRRFSVVAGVDIHERMLNSLRDKVRERKPAIIRQAYDSGIREMAARQAEDYFSYFFSGLGYPKLSIRVGSALPVDEASEPETENMIGLEGIHVLEEL